MKYRTKPVVIEAVLWEGTNFTEVEEFCPDARYEEGAFTIKTFEGTMRANKGDWIIKGIRGEFYPCKPDIFEATYDKA